MSDYIGTIRTFHTDRFTVKVDAYHKECGKRNREWAAQGKEGRCGSYFTDMIRESIKEARQTLREMGKVRVRATA